MLKGVEGVSLEACDLTWLNLVRTFIAVDPCECVAEVVG